MNRLDRLIVTMPAWIAPILAIGGCNPAAHDATPPPEPSAESRPAERPSSPSAVRPASGGQADISWDTDRDRVFAEFLRDKSAGMLRKAAVGIEKAGMLRVELDRSVAPDDTLDLTKSLMAGARKDFPDRPITLAVYDPNGDLILRSRYKVGQGVQYQLAGDSKTQTMPGDEPKSSPTPAASSSGSSNSNSGATEADRKFASWAEEHGRAYLRYVEADLEKHGRLWFGVTRDVKPADVPNLTKSLLEWARKEFPKGELVANVFDPDGEKIGRAHMQSNGEIRWER